MDAKRNPEAVFVQAASERAKHVPQLSLVNDPDETD
jgi:hypothetical protein